MDSFPNGKCKCLLSILLLFAAIDGFAQKTYNLPDLIKASQQYLPSLMQKQALINSSRAIITDVKHSFLPQIRISDQVNTGTDNSLAGSYLPIGAIPSSSAGVGATNNWQPASGNLAVLYGDFDLVTFGLNTAKLQLAKSFADLQTADYNNEWYNVQVQIAKIYLSVLKLQSRLDADRQNINRYDSIYTVIQALTQAGITAGADSSLAKAELSKTRITYNQTQGALLQLKQQLSYYTGIPSDQLLFNSLYNINQAGQPVLPAMPDTAGVHPLIDYYLKRKNIFISNGVLIKKSFLPRIILGVGTWARGSSIQYNNDYKSMATGLGYQRFNYAAAVGITYNLFNGLYKKDKLAINDFQLQASDFDLQQQQLVLRSSLLEADRSLEAIAANLQELPLQLNAATDTYLQKLAQYKAGIISLIDLTNASFVLYRSQTDYVETIYDWWLTQLNRAANTGSLITFIQTIK